MWVAYREKLSTTAADGDFGDFHHAQYRGEWANDTEAVFAGNVVNDGDGYWNTTRNQFHYLEHDPPPSRIRSLSVPHWLNTILGETGTYDWLGHSNDSADLLAQVDTFDANTIYLGVLDENMVVLDNDTFVAEVDGHNVWRWLDLVAGQPDTFQELIAHVILVGVAGFDFTASVVGGASDQITYFGRPLTEDDDLRPVLPLFTFTGDMAIDGVAAVPPVIGSSIRGLVEADRVNYPGPGNLVRPTDSCVYCLPDQKERRPQ